MIYCEQHAAQLTTLFSQSILDKKAFPIVRGTGRKMTPPVYGLPKNVEYCSLHIDLNSASFKSRLISAWRKNTFPVVTGAHNSNFAYMVTLLEFHDLKVIEVEQSG